MYKTNPTIALRQNDPSINYHSMEHILAVEMAKIKQEDTRKMIQLQKLAAESDEIKDL